MVGVRVPLRMYPKPFHAAGLVFKVQADGAQTAQAGEPITRAAFPRGCSPYCFIGDAVFLNLMPILKNKITRRANAVRLFLELVLITEDTPWCIKAA